MILHKLNPGVGKSWCGLNPKRNCVGFVNRWSDVTCPDCLSLKNKWYSTFIKKKKTKPEPKIDMAKLRAFWDERD